MEINTTQKSQTGGPVKPLSLKEEQVLEKQRDDLQDILDETEIVQGVKNEVKNPEAVKKEIQRLEQTLKHKVQPAVGNERIQIERQLKALTLDLQKGMPTWNEYVNTKKRDGMRFTHLKRLIMKWETDPVRRQKVATWKNLRRRLDPSDPQIADMMYLFPQVSQIQYV